ncbi:MAG: ABC transporter ATP-binding protein [Pseudomonadota bacterium]|nr:ABC transporter ATP-binding protein [Pseudomonadota bacterium]
MLTVSGLSSGYQGARVLHDVSFDVAAGEIVCLLGRNGAGKSTCLKTIMGLIRPTGGRVECGGVEVSGLPASEVPRHGLGYIPQGRRLFAELTVAENLEIGLMVNRKDHAFREQVLDMFPRLRERLNQRADTLSGGEQQMLATGRALCIDPSVLLLDEPTEGLQPSMIEQIRQAVTALRDRGVAILLVEQRVDAVLSIADRVVFLENGRSHDPVSASALRDDPDLLHRFVGV